MTLTTTSLTEVVRCMVSPADKELLRELARRNGSASESAIVRRLIRDEGQRLGIPAVTFGDEAPAAPSQSA